MYNISKKGHTLKLITGLPLIDINDLHIEAGLFINLHTVARLVLFAHTFRRLKQSGHEAVQAMPLVRVLVLVLVALEKDHNAVVSLKVRLKSERHLELAQDGEVHLCSLLHRPRVFFVVDSELQELDGDFLLDLWVQRLVPVVIDSFDVLYNLVIKEIFKLGR